MKLLFANLLLKKTHYGFRFFIFFFVEVLILNLYKNLMFTGIDNSVFERVHLFKLFCGSRFGKKVNGQQRVVGEAQGQPPVSIRNHIQDSRIFLDIKCLLLSVALFALYSFSAASNSSFLLNLESIENNLSTPNKVCVYPTFSRPYQWDCTGYVVCCRQARPFMATSCV